MVPGPGDHPRRRHSGRSGDSAFSNRKQNESKAELDRQSGYGLSDVRDCVGNVAAAFSPAHFRSDCGRSFYSRLGHHLCGLRSASAAGGRPCPRPGGLTSVVRAMDGLAKLPSVAIIGRPNVGKSALFNRLAGRKIAIVHDQPGITRDRISAICERGAHPFTIWDTGGIFGAGEHKLTAQVHHAAEQALRESDLLLFVVDAKEGLSPIDQELARTLRKSQKPILLVINKIDNEKHELLAAEFDSLGFESSFAISAEHDRGISDLLSEIDRCLPSS